MGQKGGKANARNPREGRSPFGAVGFAMSIALAWASRTLGALGGQLGAKIAIGKRTAMGDLAIFKN